MKLLLILTISVMTTMQRQSKPLSHLTVSLSEQIPQQSCLSALHNLNHLMSSSSEKLQKLTSLQIHRVTVILPPSWYNTTCTEGIFLSSISGALSSSDIFISNEKKGSIGVTQFAGCGKKGKDITIPVDTLEDSFNKTETSLELLDSLLKYQFGVFSTHGETNTKFPETYSIGDQIFQNCKINDDEETSYDAMAPTQQNLLCNEHSPISVIKSFLPDLQEQDLHPEYRTIFKSPKFEYAISQRTRYLLVLDRSMQAGHVWKHLHNALYR